MIANGTLAVIKKETNINTQSSSESASKQYMTAMPPTNLSNHKPIGNSRNQHFVHTTNDANNQFANPYVYHRTNTIKNLSRDVS